MYGMALNLVLCFILLYIGSCIAGDVRLVGGERGRLEMCINQEWGTVCGNNQWTNESTAVVCRQLGYSPDGGLFCMANWQ